jgi:hypothetical protein
LLLAALKCPEALTVLRMTLPPTHHATVVQKLLVLLLLLLLLLVYPL